MRYNARSVRDLLWGHIIPTCCVNTACSVGSLTQRDCGAGSTPPCSLEGSTGTADSRERYGRKYLVTGLAGAEGPAQCVSRGVNTPIQLSVLTRHAPLVVEHSVFGWSGYTASQLPVSCSVRVAEGLASVWLPIAESPEALLCQARSVRQLLW